MTTRTHHPFRILSLILAAAVVLGGLALSAAPAAAATCRAQHVVQRGETLFTIGLKYNLTWDRIAQANGIANPNRILAGQVLCIPAAATGTPGIPVTGATPTPAPTAKPRLIPTFTITGVVRDQSVTINAVNFPAGQKFTVRMGAMGTAGVNGTVVTTVDSGTGAFTGTYTIPAALRGASQIAIRLESASGYYSYNWFWNHNTQ